MQFKPVQTFLAKKAAAYLSKELNTTVSLKSIYIKPFKSVVIEDLLVLDLQKDTLLSTPKFIVDLNRLSIDKKILDINTVQVNNGAFYLKQYKEKNKGTNLDFIIDYFDSGPSTKKKSKPFQISVDRVILNNLKLRYKDLSVDSVVNGVNYDDIQLREMNGIFEHLNTKDHLMQANVKNLTFKEKSGFYLKNLSAFTTIDSNKVILKKLLLVTNKSRLTDYFEMRFRKFGDFNDYIDKVWMKAHFKNGHLASKDISFFAPELARMNLDIDVDGQITGLVNNLKAKNLSVKAGKATYVKGNFNIKGLPHLQETFMEMSFDMASTNKKDLDEILGNTTGNKTKVIPVIVEKFGSIYFKGNFTGFANDFIAFGEFKTKLGRVVSDVNMKISPKGVPTYSGNVKAYDFNLGDLLDEESLGKVTAAVNIKGKGTEINSLTEKINGDITYIDFNGYRYSNVSIDGTFDKKYFDGGLKINDKNVQLNFDGGVNLNPKLPVFNFKATIKNAKLKSLHLYQDSLKVDATFSTNFSGSNLNNIQGNLLIQKIRLDNVKGVYNIDSVGLQAKGIGADRTLKISSDVLDASIRGQYDLNTLPSYYKSLAKTYIPSLKTDIVKFNDQIFQFNLNIKRFEPVAQLFAPGLVIDGQAILIGNFDSKKKIATLNGFIKKLTYNGVIVNNIIVDENTTTNQLQAIITSDRVDLNDSLYIKDVNISNILRNDSLALNVKLSNADDANQLDLNGLVEFGKDTTARISILPSLLKINSEDWAIQDKVRINFKNGKTEINNFDLKNGNQILSIDGILSPNPSDVVTVGFKAFSLKTINPFTKTLGVKLAGNVNGQTKLYGLLGKPIIIDGLKIDSLNFNDTYIGTLTDTSSFNQESNMASAFMRIETNNKETFKVAGKVNLKDKDLNLTVKMNESEATVLAPFVSDLVSDLKGHISSDLTVTGAFDSPKINGDITLDKAQMTVNYLKTAYTLDDKVEVQNSVINIKDLVLTDVGGNKATANGTVDMNDVNNPTLDITIKAKNFMALNTTAKDNDTYFGQAYGTGTFIFKGPTNKIYIGIDAKAEKGTVFNLPLNTAETVTRKDFITFLSKDTTANSKRKLNFDGLTMSLKLQVDPGSTANIFTSLGNLSGKGNANLDLEINSLGDFDMTGDYIIETGSFDFTAQEVISKKLSIRQGGTIRWTGNPNQAQINLKAIYELRAGLTDLYSAANRGNSSNSSLRVPVEVEMGLTGLLLQPEIKLDIFFPSNPSIKEELQAYFSDPNNLNLQAFSLIIRRSFAPGPGTEDLGRQVTSGVASTATELLFNQFNNVLSSLNLDFVDINIRSLSEANASFRFFDNRIVLNAGVIDRNTTGDFSTIGFAKNNVGGEVELQALIKKDGTLIAKIANKPQTTQSIFANPGINPNTNVTSFGLAYSQQFDSFREFLQKVTGEYRRNQKKKESEKKKNANQSLNKDAITEEQKKMRQLH
ncbi:translocation/assembly module TamB domain-containing protein [Pedobacter sp. L105]|uniref:translocation/assembly module TamB domain-containing protein n=1 Tax=Pedobacter sp. L105 TaxID=1641871 RepID=UPI0020B173EB|nr:translocation/assembly module TamB domain-containing protein [Pedobacter sp. L105]